MDISTRTRTLKDFVNIIGRSGRMKSYLMCARFNSSTRLDFFGLILLTRNFRSLNVVVNMPWSRIFTNMYKFLGDLVRRLGIKNLVWWPMLAFLSIFPFERSFEVEPVEVEPCYMYDWVAMTMMSIESISWPARGDEMTKARNDEVSSEKSRIGRPWDVCKYETSQELI